MTEKPIILFHYLQTKYHLPFPNREALRTWQERQVQRQLRQILRYSPFYRRYYQGLNLNDWHNFPEIDKHIMMQQFDELNTVGIHKDEALRIAFQAEECRNFAPRINGISVGLSSGTSGNRGLFLVSDAERLRWAGVILAKLLPAPLWSGQRVAFFFRANSNLYQTINSSTIQFRFFDLLKPMPIHIEELNQYQPSIIAGPPSALRIMATAIKSGTLKINPVKVISMAEVLEPLDQAYISEHFQQPIHQVYQCTEGFLGVTCPRGTIHLNEDLVIIQKKYLDRQSRRFIPIITDLFRTTQPIIRYRLNDILVESATPCPCGSVFTTLEKIEGRCDDIFYLRSRDTTKLVPVFPDFIRRAVMQASADIDEYQVLQHHYDLIEVLVKVPDQPLLALQESLHDKLNILFNSLNCQIPQIHYSALQSEPEFRKKLRRIERKFPLDDIDQSDLIR